MGGKALNRFGIQTERKNTKEFLRIGKEIQDKINSDFDFPVETKIVTCYHEKPDHGDLDLLIKIDANFHNSDTDLIDYIKKTFKPRAIHNNGGVSSFDYQNFQIDFIPIRESRWDTANVYYSYDPLGNIMGKTFHKFGLSYGWNGLYYKFRNFHGTNSKNILISNDARKIFELGGYDYDRYLEGFETLNDILDYCIDARYFDAEIFQMKNLKAIDKKRNRKRGSYAIFLKYIDDNKITTRYAFDKNKDNYLEWIDSQFPEAELLEKLDELKVYDSESKRISQKFNGEMVMDWTEELGHKIMGKELGHLIKNFKDSFEDTEDYREFILNANFSEIKGRFMETYDN